MGFRRSPGHVHANLGVYLEGGRLGNPERLELLLSNFSRELEKQEMVSDQVRDTSDWTQALVRPFAAAAQVTRTWTSRLTFACSRNGCSPFRANIRDSEVMLRSVASQVALGIHYCHTPTAMKPIILHRDIKPENGKSFRLDK